MAAQAALVAETIAGMKRAMSSAYTSDSDNSLERPTNRGNKLIRKAQYIHEGRLNRYTSFKKRINHAGHQRYIVIRNPKRYDEYGDELDDDEEDDEADAAATESNPYAGVKIENLLAPLTSAAELPNHPSMSAAYNSTTLSELVQQACEMVHKEKKILWHIKTLATKFRGDQGWIPCETLCSVNDTALFTTNVIPDGTVISQSHNQTNPSDVDSISYHNDIRQDGHNKNRKLVEDGKATVRSQTEFLPRQTVPSMSGKMNDGVQLKISNSPNVNILSNTTIESASYLTDSVDVRSDNQDVEPEACPEVEPKGVDKEIVESSSSKDNVVGREELGSPVQYKDSVLGIIKQVNTKSKSNQVDDISTGHPEISTLAHPIARDDESEEVQAPSHRMTTRAQAQAASDKTVSTPARSPSRDSSAPEYIHPLYLIPPLALPDRDFGLPPAEAEETRYILMLWVQKQEEVCRGVERLHAGLMRANRMRKTVLGWCKAEGHVGEMSDGEDWYDKEEWGLEDDLKKGQLEEEDDTGNQGKKTRGRRTQ